MAKTHGTMALNEGNIREANRATLEKGKRAHVRSKPKEKAVKKISKFSKGGALYKHPSNTEETDKDVTLWPSDLSALLDFIGN